MANNIVSIPYEYFADPDRGRPLFNAQIFVGQADLDPEIPANQKQVTARQEDGTEVSIPQPIRTNSGGYPVLNGNPVVLLVNGSYSIKVLDRNGNLSLESPDVTNGVPITEETISDFSSLAFNTISNVNTNSEVSLSVGDRVQVYDYASGNGSGVLFFNVVAPSTGTPDGGSYIDLPDRNLQLEQVFGDEVSVKQFGAVGDWDSGTQIGTNDTTAIQSAVTFCQANNKSLRVPAGEYLHDSITIANNDDGTTIHPIKIKGDGFSKTRLIARSVTPQMLLLEGSLNNASSFNSIEGIYLVGRGMAEAGVRSGGAPHLTLRDIRGLNFTGSGLFDLSNSWASTIINCKSSFNTGSANAHGARLRGTCFGTNIISSFFFANEGWGLIIDSNINIKITGGIETNAAGGLHATSCSGLDFSGVYFEGNGSTGTVLTSTIGTESSIQTNTNVVLNGVSEYNTMYAAAFPCRAVTAESCTTQIGVAGQSFMEVFAVDGLRVNNISDVNSAEVSKTLVNVNIILNNTRATDVQIGNSSGYTNELSTFIDEFTLRNGAPGGYNFLKHGRQFNLSGDPNNFQFIFNGSDGNIPQVITTQTYKFEGRTVYNLSIASATESNQFGEIIDMDDENNAYLRGRAVYVSLLARTNGDAAVRTVVWPLDTALPLVSENFTSDDFDWSSNTIVTMPSTGTVRLGYQLANVTDNAADTADIAAFVIAPVGIDARDI